MDNLKIEDKKFVMAFESFSEQYDQELNEGIFGTKSSPEELKKDIMKRIAAWAKQGYLSAYKKKDEIMQAIEDVANSEEAKADKYRGKLWVNKGEIVYIPTKDIKYGSGLTASTVGTNA